MELQWIFDVIYNDEYLTRNLSRSRLQASYVIAQVTAIMVLYSLHIYSKI